jgi:thioredoxin
MKKLVLSIVAVLAMSAAFSQSVVHLTTDTFKKNVWDFEKNKTTWKYEGNKLAIVDFYADWCGPCKLIAPHLEDLQKEYGDRIQVYKVNTDDYGNLAGLFEIRGIPTLIMAPVNGDFVKLVGYRDKGQLKTEIEKLLK